MTVKVGRGHTLYTIQLGSFVLNGQILLLFAFGAAGWTALWGYERRMKRDHALADVSIQAFLIWLLVWKGSLLLWEPASVIQQPLSIVYFDGGVKGRWAASFAVIGYLLYHLIKRKMSFLKVAEAATIYLLAGLTVYDLGLVWFIPEQKLTFLATSTLSLLIVLSFQFTKGQILWTGFVERGLWLCIGFIGIGFLDFNRVTAFLSFDFLQIVGIAAAGGLYSILLVMKRRAS